MFSHRKLIGLSLTLLLLVMQALWLVHRPEHDRSPNAQKETACEFCLAMHGMGAAIPGPKHTVAVTLAGEYCPGYAFIVRVDAEIIQPRQQGPPGLS
ncbi:MAG: hypothetical protein LBP99_07105 [Azoarcus sp.]|jgi:hypothetical protein|nr:hypothetical protein [Azoarcus sp.]